MGGFNTIGEKFGIIYTCNCGWLDRGHSYAAPSKRAHVGVASLWDTLLKEAGPAKIIGQWTPGFVVTYRQEALKEVIGMKFFPGVEKRYVVKKGLSTVGKQKVALGIFMDVSIGFERLQGSWASRTFTGSDSGFSEEDLVSNLIGFYRTIFPMIDVEDLCKPVSVAASQAVWRANGPVGGNKNKHFRPILHPCAECTGTPKFPPQFEVIQPGATYSAPVVAGLDRRERSVGEHQDPREGEGAQVVRPRFIFHPHDGAVPVLDVPGGRADVARPPAGALDGTGGLPQFDQMVAAAK